MEVLYVLIPIALLFAAGGIIIFVRALKQGQFDDLETPAHRILLDDDTLPRTSDKKSSGSDSNPS